MFPMFVDDLLSLVIQQLTGKKALDSQPNLENCSDVSSLYRLQGIGLIPHRSTYIRIL